MAKNKDGGGGGEGAIGGGAGGQRAPPPTLPSHLVRQPPAGTDREEQEEGERG